MGVSSESPAKFSSMVVGQPQGPTSCFPGPINLDLYNGEPALGPACRTRALGTPSQPVSPWELLPTTASPLGVLGASGVFSNMEPPCHGPAPPSLKVVIRSTPKKDRDSHP